MELYPFQERDVVMSDIFMYTMAALGGTVFGIKYLRKTPLWLRLLASILWIIVWVRYW